MNRRLFLKGTLASSAVMTAISAGLLTPTRLLAASPKFKAKSDSLMDEIPNALNGNFKLKAPKIAENGAVVPITIDARKMSGVEQISILVKNATASNLSASFNLNGANGFVSTRIKMGKSSPVYALVKANGKIYKKTKDIKVTIGGCGG
ncbi:Sulfur oxidation protein SoxY [hydrothermal vent metagenome]|uniref:Sulfur oxidation protein SoxY n=1 Tax=hydrothermal vent metagenome TaxID=652676 RepID=A0A1W1CUV9_9ZZZZ